MTTNILPDHLPAGSVAVDGRKSGGWFPTKPAPTSAELQLETAPTIRPELLSASYLGIDEVPENGGVMFSEPESGGYDQIDRYEDGTTVFRRYGVPHRTDGPAIYRADGTHSHYLDGDEIFEPTGNGPALGTLLARVDSDGREHWVTGGDDQWEITRTEAGEVRFYFRDELHREGGPAFIDGNGTAEWYRHDQKIKSPLPPRPTWALADLSKGETTNTRTGANFDPNRTVAQTVRELTKHLAYAKEVGIIPFYADATVEHDKKSGTINVTVTGFSADELTQPDGMPTADSFERQQQLAQIAESFTQITYEEGSVERTASIRALVHQTSNRSAR